MKLIVAVSNDWGIGNEGGLLYNLPEDMSFFRNTTKNKVVVMGRATLLSLPGGKPLKNRTNIVLTKDKNFEHEGVIVCNSIEELFIEFKKYNSDDIFIIGGGTVYNQLFQYCEEAYITKVNQNVKADTYLHNFDEDENWELEYQSPEHINNGRSFTFNTYRNITRLITDRRSMGEQTLSGR